MPKFFRDEAAAIIFAQQKHNEFQRVGSAAFAGLAERRRTSESLHPQWGQGASVSQVASLYLDSRKNTAGYKTLKNHIGKFVGRFGALAPDALSAISVHRWLDAELDELGQRTKYGIYTSCSQLWRWAIRYDFASTSLFEKVETPKKGQSEIAILTPGQMTLAIEASPNSYTLAWLLLGGFAGLRSCEIQRMVWGDVAEEIHIRREVIKKTRGIRERYVARTAPLDRRLVVGAPTDPVIPVSETTFRYHTKRLAAAIGFADGWPHNALRDSFASYLLADCDNAALVADQMGHTSPAMVHQSYARAVKKTEAAKWWGI